jgi:hypothetical protein
MQKVTGNVGVGMTGLALATPPRQRLAFRGGGRPAVEAAARFALAWAAMMTALASGAFLGLSCGLAPGPLLALVVAQTLRHGLREGCKMALTPLVTDAPIIIIAPVVAAKLPERRSQHGESRGSSFHPAHFTWG